MVTTEVFENLKSLQEILVQKYELEGKKSDAPKQLSNQEDLLAKTQKEFIEQKASYDATQEKVSQLKAQLEERGCPERAKFEFHSRLLKGELTQTLGGGIGQSRLCMFLLRKAHIGEIKVAQL